MEKKKVLFVCTGNTCRSPMAEAIAKKLCTEEGQAFEVEFSSAGLAAYPESPASPLAIEIMAKEGIDLKEHKATQLTETLLGEQDIIFTLTSQHRRQILQYFPQYEKKIIALEPSVSDPYGGSRETYTQCAEEIKKHIGEIFKKLDKYFKL